MKGKMNEKKRNHKRTTFVMGIALIGALVIFHLACLPGSEDVQGATLTQEKVTELKSVSGKDGFTRSQSSLDGKASHYSLNVEGVIRTEQLETGSWSDGFVTFDLSQVKDLYSSDAFDWARVQEVYFKIYPIKLQNSCPAEYPAKIYASVLYAISDEEFADMKDCSCIVGGFDHSDCKNKSCPHIMYKPYGGNSGIVYEMTMDVTGDLVLKDFSDPDDILTFIN